MSSFCGSNSSLHSVSISHFTNHDNINILTKGMIKRRSKTCCIYPNFTLLKIVSVTCVSLYAWLMTLAVIGMFLRFAGQHRAWMRYLADASYWCYLAHLPLIIYLQAIVAPWRINGWLKFSFIVAVAMLVLLSIYHVGVRYTVIGSVLNGARQRPAGSARRKDMVGT